MGAVFPWACPHRQKKDDGFEPSLGYQWEGLDQERIEFYHRSKDRQFEECREKYRLNPDDSKWTQKIPKAKLEMLKVFLIRRAVALVHVLRPIEEEGKRINKMNHKGYLSEEYLQSYRDADAQCVEEIKKIRAETILLLPRSKPNALIQEAATKYKSHGRFWPEGSDHAAEGSRMLWEVLLHADWPATSINVDGIREAVAFGADIDSEHDRFGLPLRKAFERQDVGAIETLLAAGATLDITRDGSGGALSSNFVRLIELVVPARADPILKVMTKYLNESYVWTKDGVTNARVLKSYNRFGKPSVGDAVTRAQFKTYAAGTGLTKEALLEGNLMRKVRLPFWLLVQLGLVKRLEKVFASFVKTAKDATNKKSGTAADVWKVEEEACVATAFVKRVVLGTKGIIQYEEVFKAQAGEERWKELTRLAASALVFVELRQSYNFKRDPDLSVLRTLFRKCGAQADLTLAEFPPEFRVVAMASDGGKGFIVDGCTPLMVFGLSQHCSLKVAKVTIALLVEFKAQLNNAEDGSDGALQLAVAAKSKSVVKALLLAGAVPASAVAAVVAVEPATYASASELPASVAAAATLAWTQRLPTQLAADACRRSVDAVSDMEPATLADATELPASVAARESVVAMEPTTPDDPTELPASVTAVGAVVAVEPATLADETEH